MASVGYLELHWRLCHEKMMMYLHSISIDVNNLYIHTGQLAWQWKSLIWNTLYIIYCHTTYCSSIGPFPPLPLPVLTQVLVLFEKCVAHFPCKSSSICEETPSHSGTSTASSWRNCIRSTAGWKLLHYLKITWISYGSTINQNMADTM